jgi:hypothetical protein
LLHGRESIGRPATIPPPPRPPTDLFRRWVDCLVCNVLPSFRRRGTANSWDRAANSWDRAAVSHWDRVANSWDRAAISDWDRAANSLAPLVRRGIQQQSLNDWTDYDACDCVNWTNSRNNRTPDPLTCAWRDPQVTSHRPCDRVDDEQNSPRCGRDHHCGPPSAARRSASPRVWWVLHVKSAPCVLSE